MVNQRPVALEMPQGVEDRSVCQVETMLILQAGSKMRQSEEFNVQKRDLGKPSWVG
eukprot:CAMPEP_0117690300 /NCGR_PEP_ID=MMETSP0804-20121206/25050_1 /TAXON_ID=1074897 /ORGANISM="Tetraselmis astigmatica, Strain CCMP880" /LENGTH=55 /DNA_ID=CAMNT_0005503331 /DNA_START=51 /DNA_END=218 /DNA_ORIENTATION=+